MTFILIFGDDGCGKSIQARSIAEVMEEPIHLSFAVKNRDLYKDSVIESKELVILNEDYEVNPYKTMDAFHAEVRRIVKDNINKCVVIDEVTYFRAWGQPVSLEWYNHKFNKNSDKIGKDNLLAWAYLNSITYGKLTTLANWAASNNAILIAISSLKEIYLDGEGTGRFECSSTRDERKLSDIRVRLEKNGAAGKGYFATFEKYQDNHHSPDNIDTKKIDKDGLLKELIARCVIK